jgi:DNA invertase Pin-like site-specific DNA recombinase
MIYGYIRVSTDRQTVENQRFEINRFCEDKTMVVERWIEETISGTKTIEERRLGRLLKKMRQGDILICSELSRLGRNLLMIMAVLNDCMNRDIQVWTVKDNYRISNNINSKLLALSGRYLSDIGERLRLYLPHSMQNSHLFGVFCVKYNTLIHSIISLS